MNVWEARVVVRERKLAEIVDLAVRFCLALGGGLYLRLTLVTLLPAYGLCLWLLHTALPPLAVCALALALFSVLQLPFTVAAGRLMFSADVSLRDVLSTARTLFFRTFAMRLLSWLAIAGGGLIVVLVPFAFVRTLYLGEIMVLEGAGPVSAFRRMARLSYQRVVQSFCVWLSLVATSVAFIAVAQIFASSLGAEGLPIEGLAEVWGGLSAEAGIAGLFLSLPLVASLRFLAYIDNRTRREGWDIQVRFLELGRVLAEGPA